MQPIYLQGIPHLRAIWRKRSTKVVLPFVVLGTVTAVLATPPLGFLVNRILAMGSTLENIDQQVQVPGTPNTDDGPWQLQLQAQGPTDFYVQDLVLAPGGYSGWHTHPGLLIGTVLSGSIDFYNANCEKRTVTPGQVFIENNQVHAIINTGSVHTKMIISYLIKHEAARRIEADAPACAASTGIP